MGWILAIVGILFSNVLCQDKVVVGYYVPWGKVEPEAIPYEKLTHINYGFGVLTNRKKPAEITIDRYYDGNRIRKLKQLASAKKVKVLISLGGWTGSQTFSLIVRSKKLRKEFIENALVFLRNNTLPEYETKPDGWDLDGIDIDWEYPNGKGSKCNEVAPKDTENYLILLKELRKAMDKEFPKNRKLLTAAVRVTPFDGRNGKPLKDVSEFAKYFDFINIMAYDIMGSWSKTTGPNAPFNHHKKQGKDLYSFTQSVQSWLSAGFPANKLTSGLAFYGRSHTSKSAKQKSHYFEKDPKTPKGDESDSNAPNFYCNEGTEYSGVYKYKFIRQDILPNGHDGNVTKGYQRHWDPVSKTPWLFNSETRHFISYDDPESIRIKVDYVKEQDLRGIMFWDLSNDKDSELLDVARTTMYTTATPANSESTEDITATPVTLDTTEDTTIAPVTSESTEDITTPIISESNEDTTTPLTSESTEDTATSDATEESEES